MTGLAFGRRNHELPPETSLPREKSETNRRFAKPEDSDRPLVAGLRDQNSPDSLDFAQPEKGSTSFGMVVRPVDVQLFGADGRNKREKRRVVSGCGLPNAEE